MLTFFEAFADIAFLIVVDEASSYTLMRLRESEIVLTRVKPFEGVRGVFSDIGEIDTILFD